MVLDAIFRGGGYDDDYSSGSSFFSFMAGIFLTGPIGMSANWLYLKAARKENFQLSDMFAVFKRNYWNAVLANLLTMIFVVIGLFLLIVPGFIVAIRLSFVSYLIIDKKLPAMDAIKQSWEMTKGHSWTIFGMILLAILIVIAGIICLGVGMIVSIAWISAAFAVLYYSVSNKKKMNPDSTPSNS